MPETPNSPQREDWETPCPKREDGIHCTCWYDGKACCSCGDGALTDEQLEEQGSVPRGPHPLFGGGVIA